MEPLVRALAWAIGGIAAYVAASFATKAVTGEHIHEHVYKWWTGLREKLLQWTHQNHHLGIRNLVVWLDNRVSALARLAVKADTAHGVVTVTEETVDFEEACQQFPGLRTAPNMDITQMVMC